MKSFLTLMCLVLAVMATSGTAVAKDSNTSSSAKATEIDKSKSLVNINKADANTLIYYLKGIGEVKADAIVAYRKENGAFKSTKDLLKVTGIGEATFKGLEKNVSTSRGEITAPKVARSSKKRNGTQSKEKESADDDSGSTKTAVQSKGKPESDTTTSSGSVITKEKKSSSETNKKEVKTPKEGAKAKLKKKVDCKDSKNKNKKACKAVLKKVKSSSKSSSSKKESKPKKTNIKAKKKEADKK